MKYYDKPTQELINTFNKLMNRKKDSEFKPHHILRILNSRKSYDKLAAKFVKDHRDKIEIMDKFGVGDECLKSFNCFNSSMRSGTLYICKEYICFESSFLQLHKNAIAINIKEIIDVQLVSIFKKYNF